jgi:4a-hydroxytetrahydrobiopterin dehydratase
VRAAIPLAGKCAGGGTEAGKSFPDPNRPGISCQASRAGFLSGEPISTDMIDLLEATELKAALKKLPDWELDGKKIVRVFEFEEFSEGIDFVNGVAEIAEEADHHPDIRIKYTKVTLTLTTHDAGGITEADIELAKKIDHLID